MVRILGDLSGLANAFKSAATTGAKVGSGLHDAISPALAALNQTGVLGPFTEALDGVDQSIQTIKTHIHDIPLALVGVGAGVAAVGTALSFAGSKDQQAHAQLQAAVQATGKSYDTYADQIEAAIKHQEHFGSTAAQTQDALRILTQATNDPAKALQLLNTATDLAAAKHESLTSASTQLARGYNGATKVFKEFGIQVTTTTKLTSEMTKATGEVTRADNNAATAKQKLSDLMAELSAKGKISLADQVKLAQAQAAVTKAEEDGHKKVKGSAKELATAQERLALVQAQVADKTKLSVADQIKLHEAQQKVTTTTAAQRKAHEDLKQAQQDTANATLANGKAMDILGQKLKGQAAAAADTFTGKLKDIKAHIEDQVATLGQKYGPALQGAGAAMAGLGTAMKIGQTAMKAAKDAALGTRIELAALSAWEKITAAATFILDAAMDANPLVLIALAVVALVGVIILLVTHVKIVRDAFLDLWKWVKAAWNGIWQAILFVWDWIKKNWPLLLGILLGPIALAAALIYKYWDQIKKAAKAVVDYIVSIWNGLVGFFSGIPGRLWAVASGAWNFLSNEASTVYGWIVNTWNAMIRWVAGIPGDIARAMSGMWNFLSSQFTTVWGWIQGTWGRMWGWIVSLPGAVARALGGMWNVMASAMRAALNWVIDIWNSLHFKIGGWHVGPVSLPTVTIGMPTIPHLAQGGLMTQSGLVFAHAGEVITPAPAATHRGPVVHIDNAHFKETLDVEAFMRRVAWVATAKAM